jgi:hypothetical protein
MTLRVKILKQTKELAMPKETERQRKTVGRVMHEYKHAELKSGTGGKGGKVKSRKQAVAIALREAGASKSKSPAKKSASPAKIKQSLKRTTSKVARGRTAMQEKVGKSAKTRAELEVAARKRNIAGRSKMNKAQLERALRAH